MISKKKKKKKPMKNIEKQYNTNPVVFQICKNNKTNIKSKL
jgi:hypothetical protein